MLLYNVIQVEMDDIHIDMIYNLDGFSRTRISNPIDSFAVRANEEEKYTISICSPVGTMAMKKSNLILVARFM